MMRMWPCLAVALLALGRQDVVAQPTIAVVHVSGAFERYHKTIDLNAQYDALRRKRDTERDAKREKINRDARALQEEIKPGTADYYERRKQLAMLEADLQYFVESEGRRIEGSLAKSMRAIFDDIHAAVREVAEEKGIDLVLAADRMPTEVPDSPSLVQQQIHFQKVLFWSPQVDLTDEVVARLNARYKDQGGSSSLGAALPPPAEGAQARAHESPPGSRGP